MEFLLSPHVKSILCGRSMCKDGKLLCCATNCLYHPKNQPDPDFGREIEVKGHGICSRCGAKTDWGERKWSDRLQRDILYCRACGKYISTKKVIWTQKVKSKHRSCSHQYYHIECWESMFIDADAAHYYGYLGSNSEIIRLIKWASKV